MPARLHADSAKATDNLWGERWSKLVANSMANGVSAGTGLSGAQIAQNETIRHFQARLGSEAIRIGQARGYRLEEINHLPPEIIVRAGEGDAAALGRYEDRIATQRRGSAEQRPSMGQDMAKGRRTEIEFLNGFVVREGGRRSDCRRAPTSASSRSSNRSSAANSGRTRATLSICGSTEPARRLSGR